MTKTSKEWEEVLEFITKYKLVNDRSKLGQVVSILSSTKDKEGDEYSYEVFKCMILLRQELKRIKNTPDGSTKKG